MLQLVNGSPDEAFLGNYPFGESNDFLDIALSTKSSDGLRVTWRLMAPLISNDLYTFSKDARLAWQDLIKSSNWKESTEGPFAAGPRVIQ